MTPSSVTPNDVVLAPAAACRVCDKVAVSDAVRLREMMFGWREPFDYRQCHACGSLSIDEVPADLARFYPPTYYANDARLNVTQDAPWRRMAIRALVGKRLFGWGGPMPRVARRIASVPTVYVKVRPVLEGAALTSFADPVLDVGCGSVPVRLAILRKLGFRRLLGIEPYIERDTTYQGVPIQRGHLADVDGRFRLIMFHHSLEHVMDPLETLRQAHERLDPDGRCLIRTPIIGGHFWREYGPDWVELDAPRHIVVFSWAGLERLAARAGFEVVGRTWETGAWEFIASEQYRRDIAMYERRSWFTDRADTAFDAAHIAGFEAEASRLNAIGDAGRVAVWLRPVG